MLQFGDHGRTAAFPGTGHEHLVRRNAGDPVTLEARRVAVIAKAHVRERPRCCNAEAASQCRRRRDFYTAVPGLACVAEEIATIDAGHLELDERIFDVHYVGRDVVRNAAESAARTELRTERTLRLELLVEACRTARLARRRRRVDQLR